MIKTRFINQRELFEVPLPQRTDSYTPISNREIVDLIHEQALRNNLTIFDSSFKVNRDGNKTIGYFDIRAEDPEMAMRMAFKNSYDKSMSFGLAAGAQIMICQNGCITGEVVTKRKHTGSADDEVKHKIVEGFSMIGDTFETIKQARDRFKSIEIDRKLNAELVGRMFMEHDFINSVQLNIIKKECEASEKFTTIWEPGYTVWDLYNNVTHSLKESHPSTYMQDHISLHEFMMEEFK